MICSVIDHCWNVCDISCFPTLMAFVSFPTTRCVPRPSRHSTRLPGTKIRDSVLMVVHLLRLLSSASMLLDLVELSTADDAEDLFDAYQVLKKELKKQKLT